MRWPPRLRRLRPRQLRPQLRARITAVFAIGAFVLSGLVATFTFFAARSTIVGQAVSAAEQTAQGNAAEFTGALSLASASPPTAPNSAAARAARAATATELRVALANIDNTGRVVHSGSVYYPSSHSQLGVAALNDLNILQARIPSETVTEVPASLLRLARSGDAAEQIFQSGGIPFVGVAIPLSGVNYSGTYVVVLPTDQVNGILTRLVDVLLLGSVMTVLAGAVLGRWAARRVLRPLRDAARAAVSIANGELGTRIMTGDASDLAVLASSFNQMVDRLEERIAREARFTSDVAHELRSPLTTLASALAVLRARRAELSERGGAALDLLGAEVKRFQILVSDLLEISRVDAGVEGLEENLVEVGPLVEHALANAGAGDVAVSMTPEVAERWLLVDKRRFERIVTNLVENAGRYAEGVTHVVVEAEDHVVRIKVEDKGPGVPLIDRERIFDRFARGTVTAGARGRTGGSGLGLALVAEHAKVHGGRTWVEDSPSGGARFVVELPLAPDEMVDANADEERATDEIADEQVIEPEVGFLDSERLQR